MTDSAKPKRGIGYIGVGVGAFIVNGRREVLLLLRKKPPEAGTWSIPGGAVEWFEKCADAVHRECLEEVGLHVEIKELLVVVDHIVAADATHWVSLQYLCSVVSSAVVAISGDCGTESDDMKWFPLNAVPSRLSQPAQAALECYRRRVAADTQPS